MCAAVKKKQRLSIIIEIKVMNPSNRGLSHGEKKGLYSYCRGLLESGLKMNSDFSKDSSNISGLKPVPRLSDGPAWVEENQCNEPAFGELTG